MIRCTFFESQVVRSRVRLLVRTVRQNLDDFKFRSRCEREEIRRCCSRRR